jgi:hypothetical protein
MLSLRFYEDLLHKQRSYAVKSTLFGETFYCRYFGQDQTLSNTVVGGVVYMSTHNAGRVPLEIRGMQYCLFECKKFPSSSKMCIVHKARPYVPGL